jgi:phosphate transport system permease protein
MLTFPILIIVYASPLLTSEYSTSILTNKWSPEQNLYGILAFIKTTCIIALISTILATILSISINIIVFCNKNKLISKLILKVIKATTGIPTIVYSVLGLFILVPILQKYTPSSSGLSIFAAALVLSLVILPTIFFVSQAGIEDVNPNEIASATSLGASKLVIFRHIVIPSASKSFTTASILGFGRSIGDTLVALVLSGNSLRAPSSIFDTGRSLTSHIAILMPGEFDSLEFKTIFISSLILLFITFILTLLLELLNNAK